MKGLAPGQDWPTDLHQCSSTLSAVVRSVENFDGVW